MIFFF